MCGIAGIWNLDGAELSDSDLTSFTETLRHRGPDGGDIYRDNDQCIGFGHRRLSILDLSSNGKQPMSFADGRYWITYNGEVFNFIELRQELISNGYAFKSETDTEVIMASYHLWGSKCLLKFNGMWAFAIWDTKDQSIFLARDRFGIKPLYYMHKPNKKFAFASETIAFKTLSGFRRDMDNSNVTRVLQNPYSLEGYGHTIFQDIYQVLPGHYLTVKKSGVASQQQWWNTLDHLISVPADYGEQVEQFREIFEDSCKLRLRSDVPLATALSGGLDSSAVYSTIHKIMARNHGSDLKRTPGNWQKAYVTTFPGSMMDERKYAEKVVASVKGDVKYLTQNYGDINQRAINSTIKFDSIFQSPIFVVNDIYRAMANDGIKVSLDGHGVDEMLFGYSSMVADVYRAIKEVDENYASDIAMTYKNMLPDSSQQKAYQDLVLQGKTGRQLVQSAYKQIIPSRIRMFYKRIKNKRNKNIWLNDVPMAPLKNLSRAQGDIVGLPDIERVPYQNFHTTVLPTILRNFDRASMQSGMEVRMPFMDWRLVTFVFSLPTGSKVGHGYSKRILRDSMDGLLPAEIRLRKVKFGLGSPLPDWFSSEMSELISDVVRSPSFLNSAVWNGHEISDFALSRINSKSWTWNDCLRFWPYIDAFLVIRGS